MAKCAGEAAAHADTVKTPGEARRKEHQIWHQSSSFCVIRGRRWASSLLRQISNPDEEADREKRKGDKGEDLQRTGCREREGRLLQHACYPSTEIRPQNVHRDFREQENQIQDCDRKHDPGCKHEFVLQFTPLSERAAGLS
jgi:hypothetical protein